MGKRKERRIAAMISAGRRVKLDLFAEPSGDSGGSSAQDELGEEIDPRHSAGSPNSPSSSGKQPENPLLLLGQYSDDEVDEESSKRLDHATAEKSTADSTADEDEQGPVGIENGDMENNAIMDLDDYKDKLHGLETVSVSPDALQNLEDNNDRIIDSAATDDLDREAVFPEESSVQRAPDTQLPGDEISSWKVVLHEESNQYYYWNTITGETSWVVPDVLAHGNELTDAQKTASDVEGRNVALAGVQEPHSTLDSELDGSITEHVIDHSKAGNVNHETQEIYEPGAQMDEQDEETLRRIPDANQTELKIGSDSAGLLYHKASVDTLSGNGNATDADSEQYKFEPMVQEEDNSESDLGSSVLKHSEYLLERLKSLKGSKSHMQEHDWIFKKKLEVEIRLSDIKSLLPFGSSLLPFWVHCESQLKELESAIDKEVSQFSKAAQICEAEAPHKSWENEGNEIEVDGNEKKVVCSAFERSHTSADVDILKLVQKDSKNDAVNNDFLAAEYVSATGYPTAHSGYGAGVVSGVNEAAQPAELTPTTVLHGGEDVDMDVDMEVEDATPASATISRDSLAAKGFAPEEQHIQPNPPADHESFAPLEAFGVPPPPDDDWIPPPPPDNELVPPPPPDDPPESSYPPPPTYSETVPPLSYAEQYNLSYPGSNFEYYGQANTEFPASSVYGQTQGYQVAVPHPPLYYEALPSMYPAAAAVAVNPVEPVAYYDVQDGAVVPGPVVSGAQSSVLHGESGHEALDSDQIRSVESQVEAGCTSLSGTEDGVSTINGGSASMEISLTPATIQAPVTVSVVECAPTSSTTAVTTAAVAAKSTTTNAQTKVLRSKKRTVAVASTLRSNKKVSSLVDKWKAAKEELHEDEKDEPENAYESLEKKRQREIEQWRAEQIASGEAKANANFQPLGGDWRERVKRKRAQLKNEVVQTPSVALTDGNQQPDLNELSRDLLPGWQAYWDESSKLVYYGNAITSETTWTRPAK